MKTATIICPRLHPKTFTNGHNLATHFLSERRNKRRNNKQLLHLLVYQEEWKPNLSVGTRLNLAHEKSIRVNYSFLTSVHLLVFDIRNLVYLDGSNVYNLHAFFFFLQTFPSETEKENSFFYFASLCLTFRNYMNPIDMNP